MQNNLIEKDSESNNIKKYFLVMVPILLLLLIVHHLKSMSYEQFLNSAIHSNGGVMDRLYGKYFDSLSISEKRNRIKRKEKDIKVILLEFNSGFTKKTHALDKYLIEELKDNPDVQYLFEEKCELLKRVVFSREIHKIETLLKFGEFRSVGRFNSCINEIGVNMQEWPKHYSKQEFETYLKLRNWVFKGN